VIEIIKGKLIEKSPTWIIVENNGIGYKINIPLSTYHKLPERLKEISLFIHLIIREDTINLYGFSTIEEKELFLSLKSTTGIGPKSALSILSQIDSVEDFKKAIGKGELQALTRFTGIGKKTASRIILELKDKYKGLEIEEIKEEKDQKLIEEAVMALTSLGFKKKEALMAISKVKKELPFLENIEEIIRKALGYL
jgi:Holliday junction DNA helicase RuvA